ncbi:MAG: transcriptional regulator [Sphingorhabdus sp.]
MANDAFRFGDFTLHPADRQLLRGTKRIDLNSRYLDALHLLVRDADALVTKDRFLEEVWRGVPVTDEALTQCIKMLRKALDDDAASPRFIETVPKHGYRFIATVELHSVQAKGTVAAYYTPLQRFLVTGLAGMAGGTIAGAVGGLLYGFAAALGSASGGGALSALLVLWLLTTVLATVGAAGVGFGIAAADKLLQHWLTASVFGGALGGLAVGAIARLLGIDAFNLLLGASPLDFTGAFEGACLGAAAGLSLGIARRWQASHSFLTNAAISAAIGLVAGIMISLSGGKLLGGSLEALTQQFGQAGLKLAPLGGLLGEAGFGPSSEALSAGLEAMLFCACIAMMVVHAERRWAKMG